VIGLIGRPLLYVVAIVVGILVTSVCVIAAKSIGRRVPAEGEAEEAVVPRAAPAAG
jgi:PTS system fructose-specific IIC component